MTSLALAYYGDDFTGSTDALEFLTRAGVPTVLFTGTPSSAQLARYPQAKAIGVAGCTRALAPDEMERELRPAFAALRRLGAPHVHYKVCSTFDSSPTIGSIGRAIEVGAAVFGGRYVPLVVGAPPLGRYCVFGHLFARFGIGSQGEIHRLDRHPAMRRHPVTPADESDLRIHLERQTTLPVGLIDVLTLQESDEAVRLGIERLVESGTKIVLFDVLEGTHLERIGAVLNALGQPDKPCFSVGSSAIEMALGAQWQQLGRVKARSEWPQPEAVPLLVISGSCSPVTIGQIAWARSHGFVEIPLNAGAAELEAGQAVRAATTQLRSGKSVIVHTNPQNAGTAVPAAVLGAVLGRIARELVGVMNLRRVLVAGGDTSSYAARALGIEAVEMIAPLAPGAPLCQAHAPALAVDRLEVNFKGGQVGAVDYFGHVAKGAA
jgi:uncharacterized protein YgbK (DUF1537 family)